MAAPRIDEPSRASNIIALQDRIRISIASVEELHRRLNQLNSRINGAPPPIEKGPSDKVNQHECIQSLISLLENKLLDAQATLNEID